MLPASSQRFACKAHREMSRKKGHPQQNKPGERQAHLGCPFSDPPAKSDSLLVGEMEINAKRAKKLRGWMGTYVRNMTWEARWQLSPKLHEKNDACRPTAGSRILAKIAPVHTTYSQHRRFAIEQEKPV